MILIWAKVFRGRIKYHNTYLPPVICFQPFCVEAVASTNCPPFFLPKMERPMKWLKTPFKAVNEMIRTAIVMKSNKK